MSPWTDFLAAFHNLPGPAQLVLTGVAYAVLVYAAGSLVRGVATSAMARALLEDTLETFLENVLSIILWAAVAVAFLSGLGINAAALVGGLAIGGFIIGFAVKDALGNLAAGVLLLVNRPFKVGEAVELKGHGGTVEELGMALTRLKTWDGRAVTIPNGTILTEPIVNFSRNPNRRVEITVGVSYKDDADAAAKAALGAVQRDERVLDDPAPQVLLTGLGESSVGLRIWAWVPAADLFAAKSDLTRDVKQAVEAAGCTIPFPQRELHVYQKTGPGSL